VVQTCSYSIVAYCGWQVVQVGAGQVAQYANAGAFDAMTPVTMTVQNARAAKIDFIFISPLIKSCILFLLYLI